MKKHTNPIDRSAEIAPIFDGARLTLARQLAGLRKNELASRIDKSATAVTGWEAGAKRPTPATIAQLSLSLSVDPGFFAVGSKELVADGVTPHFRSLRSTTQLVRDQAFAYGKLAADVADELERHVEFPKPDVPLVAEAADDEDDGPEQAARELRRQWNIPDGPITHLIRLAEHHGVLVVFSPAGAASVDAYSFNARSRPVVVLNPVKRDYYRQRFDVAHELGHLVMHGDAEPGGRVVENQAHRFAAELLMPAAEIRDHLPTTMGASTWRALGQLKEKWGASMQAVLHRARWLGQLSDVSYRNAMTAVSARGWRRSEPGRVGVIEQPSLLPKAVELLEQEGISELQLLEQCRVPAHLFRVITARTPENVTLNVSGPDETKLATVISLLDYGRRTERDDSAPPDRPTENHLF